MTEALPAEFQDYLSFARVQRAAGAAHAAGHTDALTRLQALLADRGARAHAVAHAPGPAPGSAVACRGPRAQVDCAAAVLLAQLLPLARAPRPRQLQPFDGLRAPKAPKPLPKALSVDDAVQLASYVPPAAADPALEARDPCCRGAALRQRPALSELTGLDVQASAEASGWVDLDAAEVHVLGKGSKRRTAPLGSVAATALRAWLTQRGQLPSQASLARSSSARADGV